MNFPKLLRGRLITLLVALETTIGMTAAEEFVVVIDAGHGGKDPGAQSANKKVDEKDIALSVALRTGELIQKRHPEVTVKYTRRTDTYVTLNGRAQIANKAKADLFISIHCNAAESKEAYGAEVFVLGSEENRTTANLNAAKRENSVILLEKDYKQTYQGFDPNSPESYIIFEYLQGEYLKESIELAQDIQKELCSTAGRSNRGVHQAGFLVLHATTMPSILVELGFISNASELKLLNSAEGKEKCSNAIANGFDKYYKTLKNKAQSGTKKTSEEIQPATTAPQQAQEPSPTKSTSMTETTAGQSEKTVSKRTEGSTSGSQNANATDKKNSEKPESASKNTAEVPEAIDNAPPASGATVFKIQFLLTDAPLPAGSSQLKGLPNVSYYIEGGKCKYTCGDNTNLDSVLELRKKVAQTYSDAFLVAFRNGTKVSTADAIKAYRSKH